MAKGAESGSTQTLSVPWRVSESPLCKPDKHSLPLCLHTSRDGTLAPLQNWTVAWESVLRAQLKPAPLVLSCCSDPHHRPPPLSLYIPTPGITGGGLHTHTLFPFVPAHVLCPLS